MIAITFALYSWLWKIISDQQGVPTAMLNILFHHGRSSFGWTDARCHHLDSQHTGPSRTTLQKSILSCVQDRLELVRQGTQRHIRSPLHISPGSNGRQNSKAIKVAHPYLALSDLRDLPSYGFLSG